jgi:hypothetical protein
MASTQEPAQGTGGDTTQERLLLEAPSNADDAIKLDVGTSEAVSLYERLGPAIVASDGVCASLSGAIGVAEG